MTITPDMVADLRGREVYDSQDQKIGKVGEVYVDNATGDPKWVTVNTGMFGTKESFVPLAGARTGDNGLQVAAEKKAVKDAPHTGTDAGELSESEERDLDRHYGLSGRTAGRDADARTDARDTRTDARTSGHDTRDTRDARGDQGMTRSEERLQVGKETQEAGHVRLRKYVVTETQSVEVPVSHEEVRIEREPISGETRGGRIAEDEQSMTLHAERPVVSKETHAVENVRLDKQTVTENQTFSDDVRKEHIDVEDPSGVMGRKDSAKNTDSNKGRDHR